jgi:hypothetical protein
MDWPIHRLKATSDSVTTSQPTKDKFCNNAIETKVQRPESWIDEDNLWFFVSEKLMSGLEL